MAYRQLPISLLTGSISAPQLPHRVSLSLDAVSGFTGFAGRPAMRAAMRQASGARRQRRAARHEAYGRFAFL